MPEAFGRGMLASSAKEWAQSRKLFRERFSEESLRDTVTACERRACERGTDRARRSHGPQGSPIRGGTLCLGTIVEAIFTVNLPWNRLPVHCRSAQTRRTVDSGASSWHASSGAAF